MKKTILIDGFINKDSIVYLKKYFSVILSKEKNKKMLLSKIHKADAIILKTTQLTNNDLDKAKKLKIISRFGVGYDNLDLTYLKKKGINLRITANSNKITVAEHVFFMMLFLSKQGLKNDNLARKRIFNEDKIFFGKDLFGSNILIFGYGRIAKELVKRCIAFGMKVFVYDPYIKIIKTNQNNLQFVKNYKKILYKMDVISLHVPNTIQTKKFINFNFFEKMKKNSIFINTSRGSVVCEKSLIKVLKNNKKKIRFGLDVFEKEPPSKKNFILGSNFTILSPHSSTKTDQCFKKMSFESANNVRNFFSKKEIKNNIVKIK